MSDKKEKATKVDKRKKHLPVPGSGEVRFRVRMMKGFKRGESINVEKAKAEAWAKAGRGEIIKL